MGETPPSTVERKECDLVMKGGITSGIVYPGAVQELHSAGYQFRSIGGTSAGAIAAGLTAAAQYGGPDGFERLKTVSGQLAKEGFLLSLFQPSSEDGKALFELAEAVAGRPTVAQRIRAAIARLAALGSWPLEFTLLGIAAGGLLPLIATGVAVLFGVDPRSGLWAAAAAGVAGGVAGYCAGKLVGGAEALPHLVQRALSAENGFGLCWGHAPGALASKSGQLTDWLGWAIDFVAGKAQGDQVDRETRPLTIGDLRARGIEFRAMTSNLSEGQPYPLPFVKKNFLFREEDARRLFPEHVADHMVAAAFIEEEEGKRPRAGLPKGFHFLPHGDDFPVLLAVRMSLSFPALISALPLYKLAGSGWKKRDNGEVPDPNQDVRRHWFSDGGLSSNFPVHFFDRWLPSHPTFAINLVAADGEPKTPQLQKANPNSESDTWSHVSGLGAFFSAIWSTAQNYRDNMQSELPSYRERMVPVELTPGEGGLNLKMPPEVVNAVMERGAKAGKALASFDMDRHLWVRYLVLMKELEENLTAFRDAVGPAGTEFKALCARQLAAPATAAFPYRRNLAWCQEAERRIEQLEAALRNMQGLHFTDDCPKPPSSLRVGPDI